MDHAARSGDADRRHVAAEGRASLRRRNGASRVAAARRLVASALAAALLATPAGVQAGPASSPAEPALSTLTLLAHDKPVLTRGSYNYAPAVIRDGDRFHLYWCAGVAGDYVLHAEATDLDGPWHGTAAPAYDQAVAPSGSPDRFDGAHACDPSVIKVAGRFYLYYGGLARANGGLTAIGVAAGTDAVHFARLNGGRPIVVAAETNPDWAKQKLTYGAGQPAATYVAPYVYLSFSDSTGRGANPFNGAGQFVLRSTDPSFATGVQEFTGRGWQDRTFAKHTAEHAILDSFGIDWAYDAATDTLLAATDRAAGETTLLALDPRSLRTLATGSVPLQWREGPALLAQADRSMPPRPRCDGLSVTVFAAAGGSAADPFSWHALHYSREDVAMGDLCARRAP